MPYFFLGLPGLMFKQIQFPPDAVDDVRELVSLTPEQMGQLATLLNSKEATPPIKPAFVKAVNTTLDLNSDNKAEAVSRLSVILQSMGLAGDEAKEVVEDFRSLIEQQVDGNEAILADLDAKQDRLAAIVERQPAVTRQLRIRRIRSGTQPIIETIRTLVHLRPLYERDGEEKPSGVECLVPAMTLELKFERNDREHSATFSLSESKLDELIENLEDARLKWGVLKTKYNDQICE